MDGWFASGILKWYAVNKRDLPWRNENDPYKIWLSEIILQQTQVKQGLSYYLKFIKNYPTVKDLAKASIDKVLKDWQGLGYYSRARNLHHAAGTITSQHKGLFPSDHKHIRALKGIGDYTAAAILSFAYGQPHAVVDGNVYRLLSRVFGVSTPIDTPKGKKEFASLAQSLIDKKDPGTYNQAIMEFGSQYCKPLNPECPECIFSKKCFANQNKLVPQLPIKSKKIKVRDRFFNYIVIIDKKKNVLLSKRIDKDIWQGLYQFPLIETQQELRVEELIDLAIQKKLIKKQDNVWDVSDTYKHILSHQVLYAKFLIVKTSRLHNEKLLLANKRSLTKFAFPRLIEKHIKSCNLTELL